ncbi:MAG: zinc-regulated TonB-dependent outer membrane receptor [Myxococcota bacterium]
MHSPSIPRAGGDHIGPSSSVARRARAVAPRALAVYCALSLVLWARLGWADETPAPEAAQHVDDDVLLSPSLSAEEEAAIEAALAADIAAAPNNAEPAPLATAGSSLAATTGTTWQSVSTNLAAMNPAIAVILDAGIAWFSDDDVLQRGGHDPTSTGFFLQQVELSMGASVDPFFRFDSNIVFAQFGVEVEEAYATTLGLPWSLQVRGGQFLTHFGRSNGTHPHSWSFVDQPLVLGTFFGGEGSRGLGAEVSWLAPLPWYAEVVASATEAGGECCARSFFGGDALPVRTPLDVVGTFALKQFFPFGDDWSLSAGFSSQLGPNPTGPTNRTELYGADLYLRWRPTADPGRQSVSVTAEALHRRRQVPGSLLTDSGFYAQAVWQFALQYELGARVEAVHVSANDPLGDDAGLSTRSSVEAAFYPSHFSRVRWQAALGSPPDGTSALATRIADPVWSTFLALEVLVGAHGAHHF